MPIRIDENRTNAYIGTFYVEDASDMLELQELKKMVRNMNRMLKEDGYPHRFRLTLRGRLGKRNPAYPKYRYGPCDVALSDATRIDAYIHRVRKCRKSLSKVNGVKFKDLNLGMGIQFGPNG